MAEVILKNISKRFGADIALDDVSDDRARWLFRRASGADRGGQDDHVAHDLRVSMSPMGARSRSVAARWPG